MDITAECPRCKKTRFRIPEGQTGKHACPKCHGVTVVPAPPAKPATAASKPAAPSNSTAAPARNWATPPQPKPTQQPSTPSPPIRDGITPTHVAPPDENALKSAEKKSVRKKSSIGLLAGSGIGLLVLIASVAITLVRPKHVTPELTKPAPNPEPLDEKDEGQRRNPR